MEDDDVVHAVQELRPEVLLQLLLHPGLHPVVGARGLTRPGEAHGQAALGDVTGTQVGRHDDDRVLEVDHPALGVGQPTVFQDLQQRVEDVRVGLLDLVEQDHGERPPADLLGELAAFLVTDVAGRGSEQPGHRVLLHVLAHVELDQRVLVAEQELGQRLGQLRLADAGRASEDERAAGTLRVLQAGPGTPDRLGQRLDRVVLADHPAVQLVLHPEQPLRFLFGQLEHRDAGGGGEDLGDEFLVHLGHDVHVAGLPLLLAGGLLGQQLLLVVPQRGGLLEVLRVDGRFLLAAHLGDLLVVLAQVRRRGHATDPHPGAGLVDQVDGLVGQEAIADVAVGQLGRGDQRAVRDGHPVVRLVPVPQPLEDLDRVRDRRLGHLDGLEPALERGVLLQVLAVLVERRGTDGLQLAAGQHRLQDRGRVDGALGGTRPDEGVDLVDEQDDVPAGADLLEHLLEPLFEVAAVARPGHQGTEVQRVQLLVLDGLGDLALDDLLRQALDDRGLADTRRAHQHRVVLGPAGEHLHDPLDLFLPADDRIELALARALGEVAAELVKDQRRRRRGLRRGPGRGGLLALVPVQQLDDLLAYPVQVGAQLHQHLRGDAVALADKAEQDVLGADVVVAELQRLTQRELKHLLGPGRERDVPGRRLLALADDLLDLLPHGIQADPQRLERLGRYTFALMDEAKQDVLGADVVVIEHPGFFLRQDNNPPRSIGKPLEHVVALLTARGRDGSGPTLPTPHSSRAPTITLNTSVRLA